MKKKQIVDISGGKMDPKMLVAVLLAVFGMLLFIALALTLPQASSAVPR